MSVEKAIEWLERYIREGHRMIDEHSLLTDENGYKEFEEGIKAQEAILVLLKTHPEIQPNDSLTVEEAKLMVGEPAYYAETKKWMLIDFIAITAIDGGAKLYRRPPKEET